MTDKILIDREFLVRVQDVLSRWSEIINYQYCGSMGAMTYLQVTDDMSQPVLNEVNAALNAPQQEAVATVKRNAAGQIYMVGADGKSFDVSKHIGESFYTHPAPSVLDGWQPSDDELTNIYNTANGLDPKRHNPITTERIFTAMRAMLSAAPKPQTTDDRKDAERLKAAFHRNRKACHLHGLVQPSYSEYVAELDAAMAAQKG